MPLKDAVCTVWNKIMLWNAPSLNVNINYLEELYVFFIVMLAWKRKFLNKLIIGFGVILFIYQRLRYNVSKNS